MASGGVNTPKPTNRKNEIIWNDNRTSNINSTIPNYEVTTNQIKKNLFNNWTNDIKFSVRIRN
ncbi:hypothetical protein TWF970_011605 [Orbilia oligospora]|uniref:Uncharacterized protein n=1 Tax=Orbilia oligospora TaxID=2813651 RepID=A0A7C8VH22_ORBOL|nr:hypothetical protein TWF970_011605 [Orbilia oligospora]